MVVPVQELAIAVVQLAFGDDRELINGVDTDGF